VRVDHDALVFAEGVTEDHVRGLAADTGQCVQLRHRLRHLAAMLILDRCGGSADAFGFVAKEPRRLDYFLQFRRLRGGESSR